MGGGVHGKVKGMKLSLSLILRNIYLFLCIII